VSTNTVCLPGTEFKTPKLHRTVRASDLSYQSHGDYQANYLTVEHHTVVDLKDQFILLGRETDTGRVRIYRAHKLEYRVVQNSSHSTFCKDVFVHSVFQCTCSGWLLAR